MKTLFAIVPLLAVIFMFAFPVTYLKYARAEDTEFAALRLAKAMDCAGEAAMAACMESDSIDTDYLDETQMRMVAKRAADTFAAVLLLNYALPASERNIEYVKSHIPVMVLCENNGYYIAEQREIGDDGEVNLIFTVKRPYVIDTSPETPDSGMLYGFNLGFTKFTAVDKATLACTEGDSLSLVPYSKEHALQWANRDIDIAVNAVLKRHAATFNEPEYQRFYLPLTDDNSVGVTRVERPTLITIVRNISLGGAVSDMSSVNGVAVAPRRLVTAWTDGNGHKWYMYADEADDIDGDTFLTPEDAARAGYWPRIA